MKTKLISKVTILLIALLALIFVRQYLVSDGFKKSSSGFFGAENENAVVWCADHVVDFTVADGSVADSFKQKSLSDLRSNYCKLPTQNITDVDVDQVQWATLFESSGATGQKTQLLWSSEFEVFKFQGLAFKSVSLARQLKSK